jgi:hypothetical protein
MAVREVRGVLAEDERELARGPDDPPLGVGHHRGPARLVERLDDRLQVIHG